MGQKHDFPMAKIIWSRYNIHKYSFCLWKVCIGKLPTYNLLMKWNQQLQAPWCVLCHDQLETQTHLFCLCQFIQSVLQNVLSVMRIPGLIIENLHIKRVWKKLKSDINRKVLSLCIARITYHLWQERNIRRFQNQERHVNKVTEYCLHIIGSRTQYVANVTRKEKTRMALADYVTKAMTTSSS